MRVIFTILAVLFATSAAAQVQPGYYTTPDNGAPHIVKPRNGTIYIEAGSETAVYGNTGGKYVLKGYFYRGNESNMRAPMSKNPPYIVPKSGTSYTYHAAGYTKNYRLEKPLEVSSPSESAGTSPQRVGEIAPGYEKYMKRAQEDPQNAQMWFHVAQAALLVSTYTQAGQTELLADLLLVKAQTIRRMMPQMSENPCPDVIPQSIWEKATL